LCVCLCGVNEGSEERPGALHVGADRQPHWWMGTARDAAPAPAPAGRASPAGVRQRSFWAALEGLLRTCLGRRALSARGLRSAPLLRSGRGVLQDLI
jgi:hypothetical protein